MHTMFHLPISQDWFHVVWSTPTIARLTEPHVDEWLRANLWFVRGRERDLLVDTGNGIAPLRPVIERRVQERHKELVVVATHAHFDHIGGLHEFEQRLFHRLECPASVELDHEEMLVTAKWPDERKERLAATGWKPPPLLINAVPNASFDPFAYYIQPVDATHYVKGGDLIDLGDRKLSIIHLPGHTPGSIGLWDETNGVLFSGDVIYDSILPIDPLPELDVVAYLHTVELLRDLPADVVYAGHKEPFGQKRLKQLVEIYLQDLHRILER